MLATLQTLHGHFRWLVLLAAAVQLIMLVIAVTRKDAPAKPLRIVTSAFMGIVDLQLLLGIVLLVGRWMSLGSPGRIAFEHVGVMLTAVLLLHAARMWKRGDARAQARNFLIVLLVAILLILVGIARVTAA
jgi:heme A synthase